MTRPLMQNGTLLPDEDVLLEEEVEEEVVEVEVPHTPTLPKQESPLLQPASPEKRQQGA